MRTDAPDDILAAAAEVVERGYDEGLLDAVCRALVAERARCAKIAERAADEWVGENGASACVAIATSIRRST